MNFFFAQLLLRVHTSVGEGLFPARPSWRLSRPVSCRTSGFVTPLAHKELASANILNPEEFIGGYLVSHYLPSMCARCYTVFKIILTCSTNIFLFLFIWVYMDKQVVFLSLSKGERQAYTYVVESIISGSLGCGILSQH